jgi:hypothetical protein
MLQDTVTVTCPHCWESITLPIDLSAGDQSCVEDCPVCCAPILVDYTVDNGELADISVERE